MSKATTFSNHISHPCIIPLFFTIKEEETTITIPKMKRLSGKNTNKIITCKSSSSTTFHQLQSCPSSSAITRLIEFPTSPQRVVGADFLHFGHPNHPLSHINRPDLFTCSGCKEYGAGKRFVCRLCSDYQLHEFCALAPQSLHCHPFHPQHNLVFSAKAVKGGISTKSKCEACSKSIKGYAFKCSSSSCSFHIHPCCAMLPQEIIFSSHPHTLRLLPTPSPDSASLCGECAKKKPGRVYRCTACNYHLHAVCAKIIFNGLHDTGIRVDPDRTSKFGTAARVAVNVVTGFLGGLVEGVGEGVGQAIVQNIGTRSVQ